MVGEGGSGDQGGNRRRTRQERGGDEVVDGKRGMGVEV